MNNVTNDLETYLSIVKTELGRHPDAEDIIHELRAHIWDVANGIAAKTGASVDESFVMALEQMEEPQVLAKRFRIEQQPQTQMWMEPKSAIPEKKLTDQEFILLAVIGFIAAMIVLAVINWVARLTDVNLGPFNFFAALIQFGIIVALIIAFFYYRDEQAFKDQMERLREKFEKMDQKQVTTTATGATVIIGPKEEKKEDDWISEETKQTLSAFGVHFGGLFQVVWSIFFVIAILYVTYIAEWALFNENWFTIGLIVVIFTTITELIEGVVKLFVGEIRTSRAIKAGVNIFGFMGAIILLFFYPFDLVGWFNTFTNPTAMSIGNWILGVTSRPDFYLRILIAIGGVAQLMEAVYNLFKFGMWKPSEQRSLTM